MSSPGSARIRRWWWARLKITAATLATFLQHYPHDKYAVREILPGTTALRHSANHLNFWGPRVDADHPTAVARA